MNLLNTLLIIVTVDCGEFNQGISSEKIGRLIVVNFYNTHLVILMVNCGEFLKRTFSNCDGELR